MSDPCMTLPTAKTNPTTDNDPKAPDLTYITKNPEEAVRSFFETFKKVVEENPKNQPPESAESPDFLVRMKRSGRAVGAIYKLFLLHNPDGMFAEIREKGLRAFQPSVGPVLVVDGDTVRDVFSRHHEFTVDFYGEEMAKIICSRAGAGNNKRVHNFVLGTDDDRDFVGDRIILDQVVRHDDPPKLLKLLAEKCRQQVSAAVESARAGAEAQLDIVTELARAIPTYLIQTYLGLPLLDQQQSFDLSEDMLEWYGDDILDDPQDEKTKLSGTGLKKGDGIIPDAPTMYCWIKTAYECFFNNIARDIDVRREGFRSSRLLLCAILRELDCQKQKLAAGATIAPLGTEPAKDQVSDSMLSRLIRLQMDGGPEPHRVTDLRIAENMLGTILGIMVGLEEAIARVVDALIKLKEGKYEQSAIPAMCAFFDDAQKQARDALSEKITDEKPRRARERLTHYFREGLRLEPQAEILVRKCKSDGTRLFDEEQRPGNEYAKYAGNNPLRGGKNGDLIFVAHRSAMRDIEAADEFRLNRSNPEMTYLFQGYGRHKCLGQYIAPVAAVEVMIALLALKGLDRAGDLIMDDKQLYATKFMVKFEDGGSTEEFYP